MIVYGPHKNTPTGALPQVPCALLFCAIGDAPKAELKLCVRELPPFAGTRRHKQTMRSVGANTAEAADFPLG